MPSTWILVHNAHSRRGKRLLPRVLARLGPSFLPEGVTLLPLEISALHHWRGADAIQDELQRLVVLGGDGTANAAANWTVARGVDPLIAIVPAGTGNNLARDLQIPLDPDRAVDLAVGSVESETQRVDAISYEGEFGSRFFVQMGGLGFPADVVAWYQGLRSIPWVRFAVGCLGPLGYALIALVALGWAKLRELRGNGSYQVQIRLPDEGIDERALAVFLGNGRSTGGGFVPCPQALLNDGLLDLCLVRGGSRRSYLGLFRSFARGRHLEGHEAVLYRQTRGPLEIRLSAPSRFLADGDLSTQTTRVRLGVLPGRLRFVAPRSIGG